MLDVSLQRYAYSVITIPGGGGGREPAPNLAELPLRYAYMWISLHSYVHTLLALHMYTCVSLAEHIVLHSPITYSS